VAQRVNYDLGLRIHKTKETILDVEKKKAKLPSDFYVLNFALLVGAYRVERPALHGRQIEIAPVFNENNANCADTCVDDGNYSMGVEMHGDGGGNLVLVERAKTEVRYYEHFEKISISPNRYLSSTGMHEYNPSPNSGEIRNGFIYTNLEQGKLYISYEGAMEDDEGNLLVLDHPVINEYYEYAIKQRILENLYMNGEEVTQKMQLVEQRLRAARNNALSIVNTPDFAEMKQLWEANRKAQYAKYYNMFKSGFGW
jgi:hypothetical protein